MSLASEMAKGRGADISSVESIEAGIELMRSKDAADMVMVDVNYDISGLVGQLSLERIHVDVVACGLEGTSSSQAAQAIRAGASEYIPLPPDEEMIAVLLERVVGEESDLVFADSAMASVMHIAKQVADKNASVLITGASGTGKEVLARYIHRHSNRSQNRFVAVNCAAIPDTLLESELFGHEKGAFSGAIATRIGRFEDAHGGTLLLDEISEMDIRLQAKLLRVIQEREVDRLGGNRSISVDIRLLATSNQDLAKAVQEKRFREDLYYRLNVVGIEIPSLKDRKEDIRILSLHFAQKFLKENGMAAKKISDGALEKLLGHIWPGNVRELENTLHRAVLLGDSSEILPEDITFSAYETSTDHELVGRTVDDVEKELILETVGRIGNNERSARILGISLQIMKEKLRRYDEESAEIK